ncbi:MAG TPA: hypothetical protein PKH72_15275 [Rhodoferax sp.]|nr:hypothetical protein [Rhodoferax sp.]
MLIPYTASNFPAGSPANLVGSKNLSVTWADIVWSAVTTGKPGASHLLAHRWHSLADLVVRSHTIYANLKQRGHHVDRSTLYDSLDPTEKGATSYFLGMTMAKLFSEKLFDTSWLFHVSHASSNGTAISFKRGSKSQPDLIGQNSTGDWIVIEAKGRTNYLNSKALTKAKEQTKMIRSINGVPPTLRVALQAYFDCRLSVRIDDPSDSKPEALDIKLDMNAAMARYYAIANAVTTKNGTRETIGNQQYLTHFDPDSGITIGVEVPLLESVSSGKYEQVIANRRRLSLSVVELDANFAVYADGLFVRLDNRWSNDFMTLDPEARGN